MKEPEIRKSHDWSGTYRGIGFLVRSTDIPEFFGTSFYEPAKTVWAHYIFLHEQQVPDPDMREKMFLTPRLERMSPASPERVLYHYSEGPIADLEWHCGITFYDLVQQMPGHRVLKAGCDYQHYWDEGHRYDENICIMEAKATIDSLWRRHPDLLVRDTFTGAWVSPSSGKQEVKP